MRLSRISFAFIVLFMSALFSSCVGVVSDAEIRADGSGTIALEYRVSRLVESMGKLEGTEKWLPMPFDRVSFERMVRGLGGLTLTDFSVRTDETDRTVKANIAFSDLNALSRLLNVTGRTASFSESGGKRSLSLRVSEGGGPLDPDLKRLVDAVFKGYAVSLRFRLSSAPSAQSGGAMDADERAVDFSAPVTEILSAEKPMVWSFSWQES